MKMKFPEHIFKRWVILTAVIKDQINMQRLSPITEMFDIYIETVLKPGKSDEEMIAALSDVERILKIEPKSKSWFWDYNDKIQNIPDAERFMYLYKEMKSLLAGLPQDELPSYSRKFEPGYLEFFNDSDLFDDEEF